MPLKLVTSREAQHKKCPQFPDDTKHEGVGKIWELVREGEGLRGREGKRWAKLQHRARGGKAGLGMQGRNKLVWRVETLENPLCGGARDGDRVVAASRSYGDTQEPFTTTDQGQLHVNQRCQTAIEVIQKENSSWHLTNTRPGLSKSFGTSTAIHEDALLPTPKRCTMRS